MTSEDGTIKHYFIHAKRLSAKDAFLNDLQFSVGNLNPAFDPDVLTYSCKFVINNKGFVLITVANLNSHARNFRKILISQVIANFSCHEQVPAFPYECITTRF